MGDVLQQGDCRLAPSVRINASFNPGANGDGEPGRNAVAAGSGLNERGAIAAAYRSFLRRRLVMLRFLRVSLGCISLAALLATQLAMTPLPSDQGNDPFGDKPSPDSKAVAVRGAEKPPRDTQPLTNPFDVTSSPEIKDAENDDAVARHSPAKIRYRMEVDALETFLRMRTDLQKQIAEIEFKIALAKLNADSAENNSIPEDDIDAAISKDPQVQQAMTELSVLIRKQRELENRSQGSVRRRRARPRQGFDQDRAAKLSKTSAAPHGRW